TDSMPAPLVDQELIRGLLGRPVIEFKVRGATEIDTVLRHAELFKDVDFEKFLPAHVMGDMQTDDVDLTDAVIAIAVNGAIRALTRAHPSGQNAYGFSQLLPASAFRPGPNSVAVYWVFSHDPSSETLAELVRID
ncbi:MAG: hypothetical protein OEQ18_11405, partial [Gammaproteobacteria bacterium]|nr:hypothetical protein [Gammaproteobacteria bacterium]